MTSALTRDGCSGTWALDADSPTERVSKSMMAAIGLLFRTHGVWVALFIALLLGAAPGTGSAATCDIDFSVSYDSTNHAHVMSMTENVAEFSACDPRYVANPGHPASGFSPYVHTGSPANGGSFSTQVNAA